MPSFSDMKISKLRKECKAAGLPTNGSRNDLIERLEENIERTYFVSCSFVPSSISFHKFQTQANSRESNTSQLLHTMSLSALAICITFVQSSNEKKRITTTMINGIQQASKQQQA